MELDPGGLLGWIIVGLVAGWLAGMMMGSGRGLLFDLLIGLVGAVVGGLVFTALGFAGTYGLVGSIAIATVGAVLFIFLSRLLLGGRRSL